MRRALSASVRGERSASGSFATAFLVARGSLGAVAVSGSGAVRTGKMAWRRVPSPRARMAAAISSTESRPTRPSQRMQWTVPQRA